jgi:hypothetical protein
VRPAFWRKRKQDYLPLKEGGTWIADKDRLEAARLFFSPYALDASLSHGLLSGHWTKERVMSPGDYRNLSPRFSAENLDHNLSRRDTAHDCGVRG